MTTYIYIYILKLKFWSWSSSNLHVGMVNYHEILNHLASFRFDVLHWSTSINVNFLFKLLPYLFFFLAMEVLTLDVFMMHC